MANEGTLLEPKTHKKTRPLWIVFHGIVDDAGIGSLLQLEPIQRSLSCSAGCLSASVKFDLMSVLQNKSGTEFRNVKNVFVSVVAIQIAMLDVLLEIGLSVDGYIGYSLGELACAYLDGCLSRKEALLVAYFRGEAILSTECGLGNMIAVNLSWDEATRRCPLGVYPACHNSANSVLIAGPTKVMQGFQEDLKNEGYVVHVVGVCGYAFHTKYISPAVSCLKPELVRILGHRVRERSEKWVTSSRGGKEFSAEYITNNLESPVYFYEAFEQVPDNDNAVILEVGPRVILTEIGRDKMVLSSGFKTSLGRKADQDALTAFFAALSQLREHGVEIDFSQLEVATKAKC